MKPGQELDAKVAEAMGLDVAYDRNGEPYKKGAELEGIIIGYLPNYSTDWAAAGLAWEWLQANNPWGDPLALMPDRNDKPSVFTVDDLFEVIEFICSGETWQHVIALAVVEAAKVKVPNKAA